jgi:hypothetical protein
MKLNKELDLKKYKRFFAFGCSFTNYCWPTWADYIGRNIGEYYNFGASGSGNMLIFQQFIQAHKKYNFTKDDLVIIMWTNTTREDRYIQGCWRRNGNLETQGEGPWKNNSYVIDHRGMFMRDIGYISAVKTILQTLRCDWDFLSMVNISWHDIGWEKPEESVQSHAEHLRDLREFFIDELNSIKESYHDILGDWDTFEHAKFKDGRHETIDYHPTPIIHKKVINHIYDFKNKNPLIDNYFIKKNEELMNTKWTSAAMLMEGEYNNETKSHNTGQWPVIW